MPSPQLSSYAYGHRNSDLCVWDIVKNIQHHQHVGRLPSSVPQNHLQDLMAGPHHLPQSLIAEEDWLVMYSSCQDTIQRVRVEEREGKEEAATYIYGRPDQDGCQLVWCQEGRQWSEQMEGIHHRMFQKEQALSLSQYVNKWPLIWMLCSVFCRWFDFVYQTCCPSASKNVLS